MHDRPKNFILGKGGSILELEVAVMIYDVIAPCKQSKQALSWEFIYMVSTIE